MDGPKKKRLARRCMTRPLLIAALLSALVLSPTPATVAPAGQALPEPPPVVVAPAPAHEYIPATLQGEPVLVEVTYLGDADVTAWCNCSVCCGAWAGGPTASGAMPTEAWTVAIDPDAVSLGALVYIDGVIYINEDIPAGWACELANGILVDKYYQQHSDAQAHGRQRAQLWIVESII